MATIQCTGLVKRYGAIRVIDGLDLHIDDREFVVLLGPSGCGKSTLLRMIAGLETIDGGEIHIGEENVSARPPGERGVAMVFQSYALYPHMSVHDNIAFGLRRQRLGREEVRERVDQVADLLDLKALLGRRPKQLSGGQQQRVAMARAIVKTPRVFLFDEPLSNLDAKLREKLRIEIRKIHLSLNTTTIFVTHDQLEAMTIADRIVVLRAGEIEQQGTPSDIFNRPVTRFVADFIGSPAMNFIDCEVRRGSHGPLLVGGSVTLSVPESHADLPAPGRRVDVGLRPSRIEMFDGEREAPDGDTIANHLRGTVTLIENMGDEGQVIVDVGGRELSFVTAAFETLERGQWVSLRVDPDHIHVFSPESGASLRRRDA